MKLAVRSPERAKKIVMISPTGLARARFPIKIWLINVLSQKKDDKALEEDLSTRSFLPSSASADFDRQLARAMALATRHYCLDKSLGVYDEQSGRLKVWQLIKVMRVLFFPESKMNLAKLAVPGLVILGEHEMLYNSEKVAKRVRRFISSLAVEIIPGTGFSRAGGT